MSERRALSEAMAAHRRKALFLSMDDLDRTLLEASCGKHGRAWADITPTYACYHMTSTQARLAYCIWLGGEVAELRGTADPRGRDRLRNDAAGHVIRHTAVCDSIGDMEKEAGHNVWTEVTGLFGPFPPDMPASARGQVTNGESRRIDLAITNRSLEGQLLDPTVQDAATPTAVAAAAVAPEADPNRVLNAAEAVKKAQYPDTPPGFKLYPIAISTQMGVGDTGREYVALLGLALARRRNGTDTPHGRLVAAATREVHARVGVALMRAQADRLASCIAGSPHAALAAANRFVHTAWRDDGACDSGAAGADGQLELVTTRGRGESCGRLVARDSGHAAARRRQ